MKRIIFLDMDGVLADFDAAIVNHIDDPPEMFVPGFFRNLAVMDGAKEAVKALLANKKLEIYVGTKMTSKVPTCATEKMLWIAEHFPALKKNMTLICDKKLLRGDVLVDDDLRRWGHKFHGQFIHFDRRNPRKAWAAVVKELCK
jgi:5'(3')-deoxyribonucleotidase